MSAGEALLARTAAFAREVVMPGAPRTFKLSATVSF